MKVILLENVKKIGSIGEIIDVKRGFARNFLISNKKALYASKENISKVQKIKTELSKKDNEKKLEAKKTLEKINKKEFKVKKLSTENNELYGSVKPTEISKLIYDIEKVEIKPSMIQPVKDIRTIGKFKVKISLHSEVDAEIFVDVQSAETIQ
tara:strand:- start:92 stop:550 length:459 start_codon:yes stop_codon:yes gene_type:complete